MGQLSRIRAALRAMDARKGPIAVADELDVADAYEFVSAAFYEDPYPLGPLVRKYRRKEYVERLEGVLDEIALRLKHSDESATVKRQLAQELWEADNFIARKLMTRKKSA